MKSEKAHPTTRTLENELLQVSDHASLEHFLNRLEAVEQYDSFIQYYRSLEKVKAIPDSELQKRSDIERTYCYHILNGSKVPGRDKIIRLCLAARLDETEARRALEAGHVPTLYAKNRRDAILCFAIRSHLSVIDTNILLNSYQAAPLS